MAASQVTINEETYWINGEPFEGVRNPQTLTGSVRYWFDGEPEQNLFALTNQDTSKFLILFNEI